MDAHSTNRMKYIVRELRDTVLFSAFKGRMKCFTMLYTSTIYLGDFVKTEPDFQLGKYNRFDGKAGVCFIYVIYANSCESPAFRT